MSVLCRPDAARPPEERSVDPGRPLGDHASKATWEDLAGKWAVADARVRHLKHAVHQVRAIELIAAAHVLCPVLTRALARVVLVPRGNQDAVELELKIKVLIETDGEDLFAARSGVGEIRGVHELPPAMELLRHGRVLT